MLSNIKKCTYLSRWQGGCITTCTGSHMRMHAQIHMANAFQNSCLHVPVLWHGGVGIVGESRANRHTAVVGGKWVELAVIHISLPWVSSGETAGGVSVSVQKDSWLPSCEWPSQCNVWAVNWVREEGLLKIWHCPKYLTYHCQYCMVNKKQEPILLIFSWFPRSDN